MKIEYHKIMENCNEMQNAVMNKKIKEMQKIAPEFRDT